VNDVKLQEQLQKDHVTNTLKGMDKRKLLLPYEYFFITDVENKKEEAVNKLQLISNIRTSKHRASYQ
jgi:hypothetical protein